MLLPLVVIFLAIAAFLLSMATVWSKKPWSGREKVHAFAMFSGLVGFIYWAHFWCLV
jgi:phosphate starvation-inducible membrane PsiE